MQVRAAEKAAAGEAAARAAYEAQLVAVQGQLQPLLAELEAKKAAHAVRWLRRGGGGGK